MPASYLLRSDSLAPLGDIRRFTRSGEIDLAYQVVGDGLVGSEVSFVSAGIHELKGVPGERDLSTIES